MRKTALLLLALTLFALSPLSAETLRVGVSLQPPLTTLAEDHKTPVGLCVDLLEDMAARKGWKLVYQVDSRLSIINKLTRGELDLIIPAPLPLTDSDRLDYVPGAILVSYAQIVAPPNSRFSSLKDLSEKTIAVVRDDIHYTRFQEALQEARTKCQFIEMRNYSDVLQAVQGKRADGGLMDHFFIEENATTRACRQPHHNRPGGFPFCRGAQRQPSTSPHP
jgi:ABC-type amino acid transport substrate-binding protein